MNRLVLALAALCTLALPAVASAQQAPAGSYNFNFSDPFATGNGTLVVGGNDGVVTGITGSVTYGLNGSTTTSNIASLIAPSSTNPSITTWGSGDNLLTFDGTYFDINGLGFALTNGTLFNLFSSNAATYANPSFGIPVGTYEANNLQNPTGAANGVLNLDTVNVAAVPEPATWAMMLVGFGAIGFQMRRKRPALIPQLA